MKLYKTDKKDVFAIVVSTNPLWVYLEARTKNNIFGIGYVSFESWKMFVKVYNPQEVINEVRNTFHYETGMYIRFAGLPAIIMDIRNENEYCLKFSHTMPWCRGQNCGRNGWYSKTEMDQNVNPISIEDIDAYM